MHLLQLVDDLWRDLDRLSRMGASPADILFDPAAWVVATYRLGRALFSLPAPLRAPLLFLHRPLAMALQLFTGVELPVAAEIGGGLYLAHTGGIRISPQARIGRDCNVSRGVRVRGSPLIGDRVYLGPGARVEGSVRVGNDAAVGANSVVRRDIPDGAAVGSTRPLRMVRGRQRPPLADQLRAWLRNILPRPTQLLLRTG
ncbi:MAG: serine acetyltransferase [Deltaproteobacteria bacterium]|nr:MAG: serine acetyltransferase [Deltaproteobacteria bacterium]